MKKLIGAAVLGLLVASFGLSGCADKGAEKDAKASKDSDKSSKPKEKEKGGEALPTASAKKAEPEKSAAPAGNVPAAPSAAASAAPTASAAVVAPGGKSDVPTIEEWNAVTREVTVVGSSKLGCETKQIREWVRVSCRGKNDTGGDATGVRVTKGGGRGDDFVFTGDKVASLVYRFVEGISMEAEFKWTDKKKTLAIEWARGAPEPAAKAIFK